MTYAVTQGGRPRPFPVVEWVTGLVWQVRCGGYCITVNDQLVEIGSVSVAAETVDSVIEALRVAAGVPGRVVDIGSISVTADTVDALVAALRIAADIAEPANVADPGDFTPSGQTVRALGTAPAGTGAAAS
jgi:hypothetical protein